MTVRELIEAYRLVTRDYSTPETALGGCMDSSADFAKFAIEHGFRPYVYELVAYNTKFPEHPYNDPETWKGHFVAAIEDKAIDWTYRQFNRDAGYPNIWSVDDMLEVWEYICITDVESGEHSVHRPALEGCYVIDI